MTIKTNPDNPRSFGAQQRKKTPRKGHAEWNPRLRKQDPLALLDRSMVGRVPELIPVKISRMCQSPFGYFRGAVPVMAYDLSLVANTGITAQLCGDAHVQNLGAYAGPDGGLIFDINDFDETIRGPFEWDVKRMATSILLAGHAAKIAEDDCIASVETFLDFYCDLMQRFSRMPILNVVRYQVHRLGKIAPISKILRKAERAMPMDLLDRLTWETRNGRRFRSDPPVLRPVEGDEEKAVLASLKEYTASLLPERRHFFSYFKPLSVGFKVVGTGSVGLRAYCVLFEGNGKGDPLFLQIKQEVASGYAAYLPKDSATPKHPGQRVVEGQRAMQLQSDPMLGWTTIGPHSYLVRQLNDHKAGVDVTNLRALDLAQYSEVCGEMLARGHARSGDSRVIAGYIGNGKRFKQAIVEFAKAYAHQTSLDWKALVARQDREQEKPQT